MTENELREMLKGYQDMCMASPATEGLAKCVHVYSKRFQRKMKRLLWCRKHFGNDIRLGYAVRKFAAIAAVLLCICVVNELGAYMFGTSVWEQVRILVDGGKKERMEDAVKSESDPVEMPAVKYEKPQFIPEGFRENEMEEGQNGICRLTWKNALGKEIQYQRSKLDEKAAFTGEAEYSSKKEVFICGCEAMIYYKDEVAVLCWDDTEYSYQITYEGIGDGDACRMAESVYK